MHAGRVAVGATWVAALVGAVVILAVVPTASALVWFALAAGLAVAVGIAGQLAVAERAGFVVRLAAASSGSFAILVIGALLSLAGA